VALARAAPFFFGTVERTIAHKKAAYPNAGQAAVIFGFVLKN